MLTLSSNKVTKITKIDISFAIYPILVYFYISYTSKYKK